MQNQRFCLVSQTLVDERQGVFIRQRFDGLRQVIGRDKQQIGVFFHRAFIYVKVIDQLCKFL